MGRKIPGRKHKGVRDPEKQQKQRWDQIKDKVNAPPSNPEDQYVPKSLERVINLKNRTKSGDFTKKKLPKSERIRQNNEMFQQNPRESDKAFLNRVNNICRNVQREAAFSDKYNVDIKRDEQTGQVSVVKRPKDELLVLAKKALKEQKTGRKKKKKKEETGPKLTKSQKWQQKKNEKKAKKSAEQNLDLGERRVDVVKFGEVAHAPPSLVVPKKGKLPEGAPRPGQSSLLLKGLFSNNNSKVPVKAKKASDLVKKTIDKKGKRRDLPHALRRQLDKQQKEIIEAYKQLKKNK